MRPLTGGKDDIRLFILWSSLQGGFKEARPAVIAAIARSIGSSCAMPQRSEGWLTPCLALSLAAFSCLPEGSSINRSFAGQLSDVAESDGYRVIAEMFHARIVLAGGCRLLPGHQPSRREGRSNCPPVTRPGKSRKDRRGLTARVERCGQGGFVAAYRGYAAGIRLVEEGDHGRAVVAFDRAAEQPAQQDGDALWSARAAIHAFLCRWQTIHSSGTGAIPDGELDSALWKLTARNFALARDYFNLQKLLGLVLNYCACRSEEEPYAWLAARVAELHGEFSAGLAVGRDRLSRQVGDAASTGNSR